MNIFDLLKNESESEEPSLKEKGTELFDFLNDITKEKKDILTEENQSKYVPYLINRFLSADVSTILYAEEMNCHHRAPIRLQYDYYLHSIRPSKRYLKWHKSPKDETVELLMKYYTYSRRRAKEVLHLHNEDQIAAIKKTYETGGVSEQRRSRKK
jgi:hypothetical protein